MAETATAGPTPEGTDEDWLPRLRRLKINKLRNVRPTELVFDDAWNVLLGKNGTGKTTLLELIAATVRGDLKAFAGVEYDVEADLVFGAVQVRWKVWSEKPSALPAEVEARLPMSATGSLQRRFRAELSANSGPQATVTGSEAGFDESPGFLPSIGLLTMTLLRRQKELQLSPLQSTSSLASVERMPRGTAHRAMWSECPVAPRTGRCGAGAMTLRSPRDVDLA